MEMKKNPLKDMIRTHDELHKMFDDFFNDGWSNGNERWFLPDLKGANLPAMRRGMFKNPLTDMYETDKEIIAQIEMPGIDKKEIKLNVLDDGIEVKAEKKAEIEKDDKEKGFYSYERSYSGVYRKLPLPEYADPENAVAELKDGILKVKIPKLKIEHKNRKQIDIK